MYKIRHRTFRVFRFDGRVQPSNDITISLFPELSVASQGLHQQMEFAELSFAWICSHVDMTQDVLKGYG